MISGSLAAASIGAVLDRISDRHRALIVDLEAVPFIDSTAANTIENLAHKAGRRGLTILLTGTTEALRAELFAQGIRPPMVQFETTIETALARLNLPGGADTLHSAPAVVSPH
jgi:sulfate permease, SulP family